MSNISLATMMKVSSALAEAKKSLYKTDLETWRQVMEADISLRHALHMIDIAVDTQDKAAHIRAAEAVNAELMGVEA